jgi:hypothetical protein
MRTTLSLDDDADLARQALTQRHGTDSPAEVETFDDFMLFPPRGPLVTNEFIDQLRDEEGM